MSPLLLSLALLLQTEAPAPAAYATAIPAPAVTPASNPARAKEDPVVCKSETIPNSRLRKRTCVPRSQREVRADNHRAAFEAMQNRPTILISKGN